jgi:hypothetical protein
MTVDFSSPAPKDLSSPEDEIEKSISQLHKLIVRGLELAAVGIVSAAFWAVGSFFTGLFELPSRIETLSAEMHNMQLAHDQTNSLLTHHQDASSQLLQRIDKDIEAIRALHGAQIQEALRRIEAHRIQLAELDHDLHEVERMLASGVKR